MRGKGTVGAVESRPPPRTGQYFEAQPSVASRPGRVRLTLDDIDLELGTDRGVFSAQRIDAGTGLLLRDHVRPDPAARTVADIGCGYGPIALTLAIRAPAATVWAVDVNERALDLCRANATRHGVGDRVHAVTPDEVPADVTFDGLWSTPPIAACRR